MKPQKMKSKRNRPPNGNWVQEMEDVYKVHYPKIKNEFGYFAGFVYGLSQGSYKGCIDEPTKSILIKKSQEVIDLLKKTP